MRSTTPTTPSSASGTTSCECADIGMRAWPTICTCTVNRATRFRGCHMHSLPLHTGNPPCLGMQV